jgi:hypothetical protein
MISDVVQARAALPHRYNTSHCEIDLIGAETTSQSRWQHMMVRMEYSHGNQAGDLLSSNHYKPHWSSNHSLCARTMGVLSLGMVDTEPDDGWLKHCQWWTETKQRGMPARIRTYISSFMISA